jgi:hypothetical protein
MSLFTRRQFLTVSAATAGGVVLSGSGLASAAAKAPSTGAAAAQIPPSPTTATASSGGAAGSALVRSTFAPLIGQSFELSHGADRFAVVLRGVEDLRSIADREHCFALAFDGPSDPPLAQAVYDLARGAQVRHSVLVVPVDRGAVRSRYQVVVNSPTAGR